MRSLVVAPVVLFAALTASSSARADEDPPATAPPSAEQPAARTPAPTPGHVDNAPAEPPVAQPASAPPPASSQPPGAAPIPVVRGSGLDEGGLFVGISGGPALGLASSSEGGGMGVFEIGGGIGGRTSPRSVLHEVGIGLPFVVLGRGDHAYVGGAFTLVNRLTWHRGPFEVGVRVAPGARFGSRSRAKDAESATQLSVDASPELFLRATRELWIGLALDMLISAPTFEGSRGLPAVVAVPALKILLIPFN